MDAQIKEEADESSLIFENSGDNLPSLSFIEKYDRFLQNENNITDNLSEGDFFLEDSTLREEYAQLRSSPTGFRQNDINSRLSTGIPCKYSSVDTEVSVTDDDPINGNAEIGGQTGESKHDNSGSRCLAELIEKLEAVRRVEPDGNSIFCTDEELQSINDRYAEILDLIYEKFSESETTTIQANDPLSDGCADPDSRIGTGKTSPEKDESTRLLAEKIESVQRARDRFYEVEQAVREQIEQLELVERYKMESVG